MGSMLAHENEAPFPERLAEFFLRSFCPSGGVVLDPFSGSATVAAVAQRWDRHAFGLDLRRSQAELGHRRVKESMTVVSGIKPGRTRRPLRGQQTLFPFLDDAGDGPDAARRSGLTVA
jgi:hypothetical protein